MESAFHTLQEFYTHTKGVIYFLILIALAGFVAFWRFLDSGDR